MFKSTSKNGTKYHDLKTVLEDPLFTNCNTEYKRSKRLTNPNNDYTLQSKWVGFFIHPIHLVQQTKC